MTKATVKVLVIRNGKVVQTEEKLNVTTSAGMGALASLFIGNSSYSWKYIAIGTGSQAAVPSVSTLVAEYGRSLASCSLGTTTYTNDTATITAGWLFSSSYTIQEAGLMSANSGGTMFGYITFGPYNVVSGDYVSVAWTEQMV
jgi:hypothetical protein